MADITSVKGSLNGVALNFVACDSAGDNFTNDGTVILVIRNNDTVAHNVTIEAQKKCNQGHLHNIDKSIPAGTTVYFENMEAARFSDENGKTYVSYDTATNMEIAVLDY